MTLGSLPGTHISSPLRALQRALQLFTLIFPSPIFFPFPFLFNYYFCYLKSYQRTDRNWPDLQIDIFTRWFALHQITPRIWDVPAFGIRQAAQLEAVGTSCCLMPGLSGDSCLRDASTGGATSLCCTEPLS